MPPRQPEARGLHLRGPRVSSLGVTCGVPHDGTHLWGDDLDQLELESWFADEQRAAAAAANADGLDDGDDYAWWEQQRFHVFSKLPARRWSHVLGFGSGSGAELLPVDAERITILEAVPRRQPHAGVRCPVTYAQAQASGDLALPDGAVDLVVCFGALHHVANVSYVLREFARVAAGGGYLCLGEPIIGMGTEPAERRGLTPHERGLPLPWLRQAVDSAGWAIKAETLAVFPVVARLWRGRGSPWNSRTLVRLDATLCSVLRARVRYHATNRSQKLRPTSVYMVGQHQEG